MFLVFEISICVMRKDKTVNKMFSQTVYNSCSWDLAFVF